MRKNPAKLQFVENSIALPTIDVATRWNSTYEMITSLLKIRSFAENKLSKYHLGLSDDLWENANAIYEALEPFYISTKNLQRKDLTLSDGYKEWLSCEIRIKKMEDRYKFTESLALAITERSKSLFKSDPLLAAILLDPRFNKPQAGLLTEEQRTKATVREIFLFLSIKNYIFYFFFLYRNICYVFTNVCLKNTEFVILYRMKIFQIMKILWKNFSPEQIVTLLYQILIIYKLKF
jgi:hypothetical protein